MVVPQIDAAGKTEEGTPSFETYLAPYLGLWVSGHPTNSILCTDFGRHQSSVLLSVYRALPYYTFAIISSVSLSILNT